MTKLSTKQNGYNKEMRSVAVELSKPKYMGFCLTHGDCYRYTKSGKCVQCTSHYRRRSTKTSQRSLNNINKRLAQIHNKITFTSVCKIHGICDRYVSIGSCTECKSNNEKQYKQTHTDQIKHNNKQYSLTHATEINEYRTKYRALHIDEIKLAYKQFNIFNPGKRTAYGMEWRLNNKQKVRDHSKRQRTKNPHTVALYNERRNQYIKACTPSWYKEEEHLIKQLYLKRNELGALWNQTLQVDHIIPIIHERVCGLHCWANLQLLPSVINASKNNTFDIDEYQ